MAETPPTTTMIKAEGGCLDEIVSNAAYQLVHFFGDRPWEIVSVDARPLVVILGSPIPQVWEADVEAKAADG